MISMLDEVDQFCENSKVYIERILTSIQQKLCDKLNTYKEQITSELQHIMKRFWQLRDTTNAFKVLREQVKLKFDHLRVLERYVDDLAMDSTFSEFDIATVVSPAHQQQDQPTTTTTTTPKQYATSRRICPICKENVRWGDSIMEHTGKVHGQNLEYCCPHCNVRGALSYTLSKHLFAKHSINNSKTYLCGFTRKQFKQIYVLDAHLQTCDRYLEVCQPKNA